MGCRYHISMHEFKRSLDLVYYNSIDVYLPPKWYPKSLNISLVLETYVFIKLQLIGIGEIGTS